MIFEQRVGILECLRVRYSRTQQQSAHSGSLGHVSLRLPLLHESHIPAGLPERRGYSAKCWIPENSYVALLLRARPTGIAASVLAADSMLTNCLPKLFLTEFNRVTRVFSKVVVEPAELSLCNTYFLMGSFPLLLEGSSYYVAVRVLGCLVMP